VTDRERIDNAIQVLLEFPEVAAALARVGVFVIDHLESRRSYNQLHFELGHKSGIFLAAFAWLDNIHPDDRPEVEKLWRCVIDGSVDTFHAEYRFRDVEGGYRWLSNTGTVVYRTPDGKPLLYVGADSDISELKATQARLAELAVNDPLLGVLNRRGIEEHAEYIVSAAIRKRSSIGMLVIDVDRFKEINHAVGHAEADRLLKELVGGAAALVRKMDLIGRYGGDEIIMLIPEATRSDVLQIGTRLIELARAIDASVLEFPLTVSVGATAGVPAPDSTMQDYFRVADRALFVAKDEGRDRMSFEPYHPGKDSRIAAI